MKLDVQQIQKITTSAHSYYDAAVCDQRPDGMVLPNFKEQLALIFANVGAVLDIGCGDGNTLLQHAHIFKQGCGIDNSPAHIRLAEGAKLRSAVRNVEFFECRSSELPFEPETFDLVFSERGPLAGSSLNIQAALRVLKTGGALLAETPGQLNHHEARVVFFPQEVCSTYRHMHRLEEVKVLLERSGVEIELLAELSQKLIFSSFYEWLAYQCSVWSYLETPIPGIDRIEDYQRFYELTAGEQGTIALTSQMIWIGGRKRSNPPEYWEYKHFS